MTEFKNQIVLITGADGGLGTALVTELINRKVKKIYATGLKIDNLKSVFEKYGELVVSVELDVTNTESIQKCVLICSDTTILINNAGVEFKAPFISEKASKAASFEMKVNYIGVIEMINNFVQHLEKNKNSIIVNVLSIGSLVIVKRLGSYCASKTATHILTEAIREELSEKGIKVMAVYMGYVNTPMVPEQTKTIKSEPSDIVIEICNGIELGNDRIYPDQITKNFIAKNPINTLYFE
ncbi:MAG: SDR family NAD(P)-dependent oxidoreductase [Bacteroidetes bacterium]|nr:SDR family NAD(P)-dependent oxidoreductase [Bacteroidota bacterium]